MANCLLKERSIIMAMLKIFLCSILVANLCLWPSPINAASTKQQISFNVLGVPLSAFKIRRLKAKGIKDPKPVPGVELVGSLQLPTGAGPFPLVILNHDCRGIKPFHSVYAKKLASWGYASFLIDAYNPRGVVAGTVCPNIANWDTKDFIASRTSDIYGAVKLLRSYPKIDGNKIVLLGWDRDSTMSAVARLGIAASNPTLVPKAAVAFYPDCRRISSGEFAVPILIIAAEKDDWWPAASCQKMKHAASKSNGAPVTLKLLAKAQHGFDDPDVGSKIVLEKAFNPNKNPTRGATFAYNADASKAALETLKQFLQQAFR